MFIKMFRIFLTYLRHFFGHEFLKPPMRRIRLCLTSAEEDSVKLKFMVARRTSMWCRDESRVSAPDIMVHEIGLYLNRVAGILSCY